MSLKNQSGTNQAKKWQVIKYEPLYTQEHAIKLHNSDYKFILHISCLKIQLTSDQNSTTTAFKIKTKKAKGKTH